MTYVALIVTAVRALRVLCDETAEGLVDAIGHALDGIEEKLTPRGKAEHRARAVLSYVAEAVLKDTTDA
jgi:hypothetical protein